MNNNLRNTWAPLSVFFIFSLLLLTPFAHADNPSTDAIVAIVNDDVITCGHCRSAEG
jgi:hypothetical protein